MEEKMDPNGGIANAGPQVFPEFNKIPEDYYLLVKFDDEVVEQINARIRVLLDTMGLVEHEGVVGTLMKYVNSVITAESPFERIVTIGAEINLAVLILSKVNDLAPGRRHINPEIIVNYVKGETNNLRSRVRNPNLDISEDRIVALCNDDVLPIEDSCLHYGSARDEDEVSQRELIDAYQKLATASFDGEITPQETAARNVRIDHVQSFKAICKAFGNNQAFPRYIHMRILDALAMLINQPYRLYDLFSISDERTPGPTQYSSRARSIVAFRNMIFGCVLAPLQSVSEDFFRYVIQEVNKVSVMQSITLNDMMNYINASKTNQPLLTSNLDGFFSALSAPFTDAESNFIGKFNILWNEIDHYIEINKLLPRRPEGSTNEQFVFGKVGSSLSLIINDIETNKLDSFIYKHAEYIPEFQHFDVNEDEIVRLCKAVFNAMSSLISYSTDTLIHRNDIQKLYSLHPGCAFPAWINRNLITRHLHFQPPVIKSGSLLVKIPDHILNVEFTSACLRNSGYVKIAGVKNLHTALIKEIHGNVVYIPNDTIVAKMTSYKLYKGSNKCFIPASLCVDGMTTSLDLLDMYLDGSYDTVDKTDDLVNVNLYDGAINKETFINLRNASDFVMGNIFQHLGIRAGYMTEAFKNAAICFGAAEALSGVGLLFIPSGPNQGSCEINDLKKIKVDLKKMTLTAHAGSDSAYVFHNQTANNDLLVWGRTGAEMIGYAFSGLDIESEKTKVEAYTKTFTDKPFGKIVQDYFVWQKKHLKENVRVVPIISSLRRIVAFVVLYQSVPNISDKRQRWTYAAKNKEMITVAEPYSRTLTKEKFEHVVAVSSICIKEPFYKQSLEKIVTKSFFPELGMSRGALYAVDSILYSPNGRMGLSHNGTFNPPSVDLTESNFPGYSDSDAKWIGIGQAFKSTGSSEKAEGFGADIAEKALKLQNELEAEEKLRREKLDKESERSASGDDETKDKKKNITQKAVDASMPEQISDDPSLGQPTDPEP